MGLISKIKRTGLIYSFAILFNRIVPQWLFRCRRFVIYQLDVDRQSYVSKKRNDATGSKNPHDVVVQWCESESDFQAVETTTYFRRELTTGELKAVKATIDGQMAGGFWAATGQFDESELGVRLLLEPDQVWLFAAYVDKNFRRRGVYNQILAFMVPDLAKQGFNQPLVAVNPNNVGSNIVHKSHSTRQFGSVFAIRFLKMTVCWSVGDLKKSRLISWNSKTNPIELSI